MKNKIINAVLGKSGVITYIDINGKKINELRHPDDIFSPETIKSMRNIPFLGNKETSTMDVDKNEIAGFVHGEIIRDIDFMRCSIKLKNKKDVAFPKSKENIIAGAYTCDTIDESGVYNGVEYDKRQVNIRYNHVYMPSIVLGFSNKDLF